MKSIQVTKFKSSALSNEFNSVKSIEIADNPFDNGAFGEVYICNSVNGVKLSTTQVLKIFIDDGSGSAMRGFKTINKLQEQIIAHNTYLNQKNEKLIQNISALYALPQFSYEGIINGKKVLGYSANLLSDSKWNLFSKIFNEEDLDKRKVLRNRFYNLPIDHRLKLAYDLVEGFSHLEQMKFIYADLNPKNFFINEKDGQLCLIDYEGGAINDNPETYGKPGEWLAPEILEQLLNSHSNIIKVDLNTDTWAVAIAIHFMLFNFHPLFFLKVRGKKEMQQYFLKHKWPEADKRVSNFRSELAGTYDWYISKLQTEIPILLRTAFSDTINNGFQNPNRRLSYKQWMRALASLMLPPNIINFNIDKPVIIDGLPVVLSWNVEKAHTLHIDNGIGSVTGTTEVRVRPVKNTTYKLTAIGHFGHSSKTVDVTIFPTPVIESLKVPTPTFDVRLNLGAVNITSPNINLAVNLERDKLSSLNNEFVSLHYDVANVKKMKFKNEEFWSVSTIFNKIKKQFVNGL